MLIIPLSPDSDISCRKPDSVVIPDSSLSVARVICRSMRNEVHNHIFYIVAYSNDNDGTWHNLTPSYKIEREIEIDSLLIIILQPGVELHDYLQLNIITLKNIYIYILLLILPDI